MRAGVYGPAGGVEPFPRRKARPQQQEHFLDEIGHLQGPTSSESVPNWDHGQEVNGEQQAPAEPWITCERECQMEFPRFEAVRELFPAVLDESQRDTRGRAAPARKEAGLALERLGRGSEAEYSRLTGPKRPGALSERLRAGEKVAALS
jgi:hypothetical protein